MFPVLHGLAFALVAKLYDYSFTRLITMNDLEVRIRWSYCSPFADGKQMQLLLNVGGPDRVSRVQMAETVARIRGYNEVLIKSVSASSVGPISQYEMGIKPFLDHIFDCTFTFL